MDVERVKIDDLVSPEYNPRHITLEALESLKQSIDEFGYIDPLIVNKVNMHIVGGNQRYECLKALDYTEIDVVFIEEPDINREKALNIRLNNNSGDWDIGKLDNIFNELELTGFDLSLTGFATGNLQPFNVEPETTIPSSETVTTDLNTGLKPLPTSESIEVEEDNYTEPAEEELKVHVAKGDLFKLGNHYLFCGDATNEKDVEILLNAERERERERALVDICFTSPPYNVGIAPTYEQIKLNKTSKYDNNNDNLSTQEYTKFLTDFTNNALKHCEYVFINIQSLANNKQSLIDWMYRLKNKFADTMIWDKQNAAPALPQNVLNSQFEYVHIFSNKGNRSIGTIPFRGTLSNIIRISRERNKYADIHNAVFPIQLPAYIISNFAKETILDLFGGTGTSLIASEQLNKQCFMMELSPKYCQVIINRWETYTGQKAEKIN